VPPGPSRKSAPGLCGFCCRRKVGGVIPGTSGTQLAKIAFISWGSYSFFVLLSPRPNPTRVPHYAPHPGMCQPVGFSLSCENQIAQSGFNSVSIRVSCPPPRTHHTQPARTSSNAMPSGRRRSEQRQSEGSLDCFHGKPDDGSSRSGAANVLMTVSPLGERPLSARIREVTPAVGDPAAERSMAITAMGCFPPPEMMIPCPSSPAAKRRAAATSGSPNLNARRYTSTCGA